jgi:hypothetical protein
MKPLGIAAGGLKMCDVGRPQAVHVGFAVEHQAIFTFIRWSA